MLIPLTAGSVLGCVLFIWLLSQVTVEHGHLGPFICHPNTRFTKGSDSLTETLKLQWMVSHAVTRQPWREHPPEPCLPLSRRPPGRWLALQPVLGSKHGLSQQVDGGLTLSDLPVHMLSNILYRLSDGWDIVTLGQVTPTLSMLSEDRHLWKKLCQYHFAEKQVSVAPGAAQGCAELTKVTSGRACLSCSERAMILKSDPEQRAGQEWVPPNPASFLGLEPHSLDGI